MKETLLVCDRHTEEHRLAVDRLFLRTAKGQKVIADVCEECLDVPVRAWLSANGTRRSTTRKRGKHGSLSARLLALLVSRPGMTGQELARALNVPKLTAPYRLLRDGRVKAVGTGRQRVWTITPKGRQAVKDAT